MFKMMDKVCGPWLDRFQAAADKNPAAAFTKVLVGGAFLAIGTCVLVGWLHS